jgi:hypothetical protein
MYTEYHRSYYEKNKIQILEKAKEKKYWKAHYERNKEEIKRKALERYYLKKENKN